MKMQFKLISPDAPEYGAERMLRWETLRKPLGMPPGSEAIEDELTSLHLVAVEGKTVVGCVCFHPENKKKGRIFQMALSEDYRGRGFGRKLLTTMEQMLKDRGFENIYLDAREEAEGFYQRLGYHSEGELFSKLGMNHRVMHKELKR